VVVVVVVIVVVVVGAAGSSVLLCVWIYVNLRSQILVRIGREYIVIMRRTHAVRLHECRAKSRERVRERERETWSEIESHPIAATVVYMYT